MGNDAVCNSISDEIAVPFAIYRSIQSMQDAGGNTQDFQPRNTALKLDASVHIGIFLVKVKYRREYQLCNRSPMSLSQAAYRDYVEGNLREWWVLTEDNGGSLFREDMLPTTYTYSLLSLRFCNCLSYEMEYPPFHVTVLYICTLRPAV